MNKPISVFIKVLFISLGFVLLPNTIFGQALNHQDFLKMMENSKTNIFNDCIQQFDDYLRENPNDVAVHVEKCKFIQHAFYDYEDDYNPKQEEFESCVSHLKSIFPQYPDVLLLQTHSLWGEELEVALKDVEANYNRKPSDWTKENAAKLFEALGNYYYYDDQNKTAHNYYSKAIEFDSNIKHKVNFVSLLKEIGLNELAIHSIVSADVSNDEAWELNQKANLLLELNAYNAAFDMFNKVAKKDSSYISNQSLAQTLVALGQTDLARNYLLKDTAMAWNAESAKRSLFLHDLKYSDSETAATSYNIFRNHGISVDPLFLYRLQLIFKSPFNGWQFRDLIGLSLLVLTLVILILLPSIWILPFYFVGHRWKLVSTEKIKSTHWGLKSFWIVSAVILIATLFSYLSDPEMLYSEIYETYYSGPDNEQLFEAKALLIYQVLVVLVGFVILFKRGFKVIYSNYWGGYQTVFIPILAFIGLLFFSGIYRTVYTALFETSLLTQNETYSIGAPREDIIAFISVYGYGIGFLFICILIPIAEEVIFRGVILDSCKRYTNFNVANIFQSSLFALVHPEIAMFPIFFAFGMVAGYLRRGSKDLLPAIIMHVIFNLMAFVVMKAYNLI